MNKRLRMNSVMAIAILAPVFCFADTFIIDSLHDVRTLRLAGDLSSAQAIAENMLENVASKSDAIRLHLELSKIHDRVGLHNNTRPATESLAHIDAAAQLLCDEDTQSSAQIQLAYGDYYYRAEMPDREFTRASRHIKDAIEKFQASEDTEGEADAVHRLGLIHLQKRDLKTARMLFEKSLVLDKIDGGRVWFLGEYGRHVGYVHQFSDDLEAAIPFYEQSHEARLEAGAIDASMFSAITLASALHQLGRGTEALSFVEYALGIADHIDSPQGKLRAERVLEMLQATP